MYQLLFILVGLNSVQVVTLYSNGDVQSACESMTPQHRSFRPQNTPRPYKIDTANTSVDDETMVFLRATSKPFRGFLLEAEDSQGRRPVGTFILTDPAQSQLLNCSGNTASAVSHTRNNDKNEISVKWKRPKDGDHTVTFRATFVQKFNTFWIDELPGLISTTSPTTITTTAASTMTVSYETSKPSATTLTTSVINTPSTMTASMISTTTELVNLAVVLMYGIQTKMADYSHSGLSFQVHVLLMSLFAIGNIIAFIFVLVEGWRTEPHPVLVCVVTVLTLIQIIVTFFRCGQTHELRFIFNWFHRLNAFAIICLTVAAVFTGLASIEANSVHNILQKLMAGLIAWELLFFIIQFSLSWWRKKDEDDCAAKMKVVHTVLQIAMLIVFSLGNAAFLVVLLGRIFTS